jgi:hypothetical protein
MDVDLSTLVSSTAKYRLYAAVFFKTLHLQSSFAGTTISCLLGKQLQEVQKSDSGLTILVLLQGQAELDQCMVFSLSCCDSVQVRFDWGITGAIPTH